MGVETVISSPLTPGTIPSTEATPPRRPSEDLRQYEREEREMFSNLEKPRVRYDVEVITKLIVYTGNIYNDVFQHVAYFVAGIAWLSVEGNPILFELIGLGLGSKGG